MILRRRVGHHGRYGKEVRLVAIYSVAVKNRSHDTFLKLSCTLVVLHLFTVLHHIPTEVGGNYLRQIKARAFVLEYLYSFRNKKKVPFFVHEILHFQFSVLLLYCSVDGGGPNLPGNTLELVLYHYCCKITSIELSENKVRGRKGAVSVTLTIVEMVGS